MQSTLTTVIFPLICHLHAQSAPNDDRLMKIDSFENHIFSKSGDSNYPQYQEGFSHWKKLSGTLPQVPTWDFFNSHFSCGNCLTFLDNFANLDLERNTLPVIIRLPRPVVFESKAVWTLLEIPRNSSFNIFTECTSPYFRKTTMIYYEVKDTCLRINIKEFLMHSKPWKCQIKVGIFPPLELYEGLRGAPAPFWNNIRENSFMQSTTPRMYLIVKPDHAPELPGIFILRWLRHTFESQILQSKIFLIVSVMKVDLPFESKGTICSVAVIKLCPGCFSTAQKFWKTSEQKVYKTRRVPENAFALTEGYPSSTDLQEIAFQKPENNIVFDHVILKIAECQTSPSSQPFESNPVDNAAENVGKAIGAIWKSIFKNYSVVSPESLREYLGSCKDADKIKAKVRDNFETTLEEAYYPIDYNYPYPSIQDPTGTLKFVSCGSRKRSQTLPFSELLVPFDVTTWFVTLASVAVLTIAIQTNRPVDFTNHYGNFMSLLKVLLEQGNPFPRHILLSPKSRILSLIFLLVGIVLSNAYKNTNVYRMILPRHPVPIEYFRELVENNFTVYTSVTSFEIPKFPVKSYCTGMKLWRRNNYYCVQKAVESVKGMSKKFRKYFELLGKKQNYTEMLNYTFHQVKSTAIYRHGVVNRSMLHPHIEQALKNSHSPNMEMHRRDQLYLHSALQSCENTALVIPEHMCRYHLRKLKKEKSHVEVHIGKEVYSDFGWFFSLRGIVPPHVAKNIQNLRVSGIWEWSVKISVINYSYKGAEHEITPTAANMHGNIVIIFAVWLVGLAVSSSWFLLEKLAEILGAFGRYCTYRFLPL